MSSKLYGIDFGTSVIKIYKKNNGVIYDSKNIIAVADSERIIAYGDEAFDMLGKTPSNIDITFPVRNGVIADIENMTALLNSVFAELEKKHGKIAGSEFIVASPTDITEVEKRAFVDLVASSDAKTKKIRIVEKPIANALGAGLDVTNANGVMIVDIGADTTEISVLSLGGIVISKMVSVGGNKFDESIIANVRKKHNLLIGQKTAETIKKELASAVAPEPKSIKVFGRDVVNGLPTEKEITAEFVYETIQELLSTIVDSIRIVLEKTPPEISADIIDNGIFVTGGSARIRGLDKLFSIETELDINICEDPGNTVAVGLGRIIEDPKLDCLAGTMRQSFYN